jgi:thioredoxin 1
MKPLLLNDENFKKEVLDSNEPVLVDFWATWCGPCKAIAPIIEQITEEYSGKLKVGKLDVDANPKISTDYGIMGIPTILLFKNGKIVEQVVGAVPKNYLITKINKHIS